jgi:hypothetical protein
MSTNSIGSVSFFVNVHPHQEACITDGYALDIEKALLDYFKDQLQQHQLAELVVVEGSTWERGCIIITLTLAVATSLAGNIPAAGMAVAAGSAAGVGIVKTIKDYPKIREGVKAIIEDMKGVVIRVRKKFNRKAKGTEQQEEAVTGQSPMSETDIWIEKIEAYKNMVDSVKKYYQAGQKDTVVSDAEINESHVVAVLKEDLISFIRETPVEKAKKISKTE